MEIITGVGAEGQEGERSQYLYHHSRPLQYIEYGIVQQARTQDEAYGGAYDWTERALGFYPVFLAVGKTEEDIHMTGYQNQWSRKLGFDTYREKGDIDNQVLFSFNDIPNGIFMDYINWHILLNSQDRGYNISDRERSMILRPSWNKADWLRYAKRNPGCVQLVVPELDLRKADSIWVRNNATKKEAERMGFKGVDTQRLKVPPSFF